MYAALLDCIVVPNNNFYTNNVFISFSRFHSDGRLRYRLFLPFDICSV